MHHGGSSRFRFWIIPHPLPHTVHLNVFARRVLHGSETRRAVLNEKCATMMTMTMTTTITTTTIATTMTITKTMTATTMTLTTTTMTTATTTMTTMTMTVKATCVYPI